MPIDPIIIGGASQAIGAGINAVSTGIQNKKNRKWSEHMYGRQFDDNLQLWHLQNQYNSPSAQMQRLQEAGLNPALMYGQSASGAAGNAQSAKGADYKTPNTSTPEYGGVLESAIPTLMAYYDIEKKKAEVNNLEVDNTIKIEDHLLRRSQRKTSEFNLSLESELRGTSLEARKEDLRKKKTERDILVNKDEREAVKHEKDVTRIAEIILNLRVQRAQTKAEINRIKQAAANLRKDGRLKELDLELRELRINPNDPLIMRIIGGILDEYLKQKGSVLKY